MRTLVRLVEHRENGHGTAEVVDVAVDSSTTGAHEGKRMRGRGTALLERMTWAAPASVEAFEAEHDDSGHDSPPFAVIAVTVSNVTARGKFRRSGDTAPANDSATRALWRRARSDAGRWYCR